MMDASLLPPFFLNTSPRSESSILASKSWWSCPSWDMEAVNDFASSKAGNDLHSLGHRVSSGGEELQLEPAHTGG